MSIHRMTDKQFKRFEHDFFEVEDDGRLSNDDE